MRFADEVHDTAKNRHAMCTDERLAYSVEEAMRLLSIGRKKFYAEAKAGRLKLRKSGRRTLVLAEDLRAYLAASPVLTFPEPRS